MVHRPRTAHRLTCRSRSTCSRCCMPRIHTRPLVAGRPWETKHQYRIGATVQRDRGSGQWYKGVCPITPLPVVLGAPEGDMGLGRVVPCEFSAPPQKRARPQRKRPQCSRANPRHLGPRVPPRLHRMWEVLVGGDGPKPVLGRTLWEALPAPASEGCRGAAAAPVSRGTSVPLSPSENAFPQWLGASDVDHFFPKAPKLTRTPESTDRRTYWALMAPPRPPPRPAEQAM